MSRSTKRNNGKTAFVLLSVVAGMVGLAYASVPLYQLFCQVTGYGGTPKTDIAATSDTVSDRTITIRFDANVNSKLKWQFAPAQKEVTVKLGEQALTAYVARNVTGEALSGTATFNVTPYKAGPYFNKVDCFCFTEQTLEPGQEVDMPVTFFVDPEILTNPNTKDVSTITLSYTFYPLKGTDGGKAPKTASADDPRDG